MVMDTYYIDIGGFFGIIYCKQTCLRIFIYKHTNTWNFIAYMLKKSAVDFKVKDVH